MRHTKKIVSPLIALLAMFTLAGCEYSELNGIGTRTADEEFPPQLDLASFDGCEAGDLNQLKASGELINNSATTSTYEVIVAFADDNGVRLDEKSAWVRDLRPGERAAIDHQWWIDGRERFAQCDLLLINRWS